MPNKPKMGMSSDYKILLFVIKAETEILLNP